MSRIICSSLLREAPVAGCLLLYLEEEVLKRHCLRRQSLTGIARALQLTPAEVRRIHDRACLRLQVAVDRLLADVDPGRRRTPTATLLRQISRPPDRPAPGRPRRPSPPLRDSLPRAA